MNLGTKTDSKAKKVKLYLPKPFNGKRESLKMFLQDSQMYILINAEMYDTNLKKIAFMLSLMVEGDAASWKQQLIEETLDRALLAGTNPDFGTFGNFIGSLKEAFEPYDPEGDVLEEMKSLRIRNMLIDDTAGARWCFPWKNPSRDTFCDFQRGFPTETQKVFLKEKSEKHIMHYVFLSGFP